MPSPGPSEEILDPRSIPRKASFKLGDGKNNPERNVPNENNSEATDRESLNYASSRKTFLRILDELL